MDGNIQTGKDGNQVLFFFKNGFGASVIDYGYGGKGHPTNHDPTNPLYELALIRGTKAKWDLTYDKRRGFEDVKGWLDADEVVKTLAKIRRFKA